MLSGTMEICDFFIKLVISLPLTVGQSIDTGTGDLKPHFEATFISTYTTPRRSISHGNERTKLERPYQVTQTASAVKHPSTSQPTIVSNMNNSFAFPLPLFQNGLMSKPDYFPTEMKPPLMLEQIPLAIYQTMNFSNIFQSASLGSQPGMMVEGPGTDFMRPYPFNNFTHVYEDLLPKPVYIGYPGMIGGDEQVKLQTQANRLSSLYGRLSSNTDVHVPKQDLSSYENVKPIYYYSTHDAFDMSNQSNKNKTNENKTELFDGHQSSLNEAMQTFQPIMSGYQWHGEWPGNTESENNQDWSRGWVDTGSNKEDEEKSNTRHQMTRISVNNADKGVDFGFMTSTINAGSPKVDQAIQSNKDKLDNMQQTLDTFQKFLSFLKNAGVPLGQERGNKEDSTYNELAKGWAKDTIIECLSVNSVQTDDVLVDKCTLRRITHSDFRTDFVVQSMSVTDIDSDGTYEVIVAVNDGPNLILQYSRKKQAYTDVSADRDDFLPVRDIYGKTVDMCACDVDGDGREELFLLNEKSLLGTSADVQQSKLLKYDNGSFVDLLSQPENKDFADAISGKFATCIDHDGDGAYSILLGSYRNNGSGAYMLFTANKSNNGTIVFREISREVGLNSIKDGTSAVIGQIVNEFGYNDIFITNSNDYFVNSNIFRHTSSHALFSNHRNKNFVDVSDSLEQDDFHVSFGAALTDLNSDRTVDILTCSLYGPTRIYLQSLTNKTFQTVTGDNFTVPSGCMNLMVADLDNDGNVEVFKDNMMNDGTYNNGIFQVLHVTSEQQVTSVNEQIDEHLLKAHIQGLTVADLNDDGLLELFIGDKQNSGMSTVSIYQEVDNSPNNWLRIVPLTKKGAPARGSKVSLTLDNFRTSTFIIGGGCSRACQTEPVAHFGLGDNVPRELDVTWPDGHKIRMFLRQNHRRKTLQIAYTGQVSEFISSLTPTDDVSVHSMSKKHDISRVLLISLTFLTFYICHYVFKSIFNSS